MYIEAKVFVWLLGWRAYIVTKADVPICVKCNFTEILIKHINACRPRDGGLKTPLEWERGVNLKGNILIIFPKSIIMGYVFILSS
jgi:hypothetical protein